MPASFSARVIRARECPASRWAKTHRTTAAVCGFGSSGEPAVPRTRARGSGAGRHRPAGTRRRPTAQVPALFAGLRRHRGPHPDPGPGDRPFGLHAEGEHQLLIALGGEVYPAAGLRQPQLHP